MKVYTYNKDGYYIKEHDCQPCPITKGWLYPNLYTEKKPLKLKENTINFFDGSKWILKDDFRGIKVWNKKDGSIKLNSTLKIEDGFTDIEKPEEPYYKFDKKKWVEDKDSKKEHENNIIKSELIRLDFTITREQENIYDLLLGKELLKESDILKVTKDRIKAKKELRLKLK